MATELDETKAFLNERIQVAFPGTDVDPGSPYDAQVVQPFLSRIGPDPFDTPMREFILARLRAEFPDLVIQDGEPLDDLVVKAMTALLEPFRRQINRVTRNLSLSNPATLNDREADNLGSNFFVRRRRGGFSSGVARLYFTAPQAVFVTPINAVFTGGGLKFFPSENQSITTDRMLFNTTGSLYHFDIAVRAEKQGKVYNIVKGSLVGIEGVPSSVKVANLSDFEEGDDRETTEQFIARIERSLSEKSLVSFRGINARLLDLFESIRAIQVIGHGDIEMKRDLLTGGLEATYAYAEVTTSLNTLTLVSAGKVIDSSGATNGTFSTAGVKIGDVATHLDLTTGKLTNLTVSAVTAMALTVTPNPPTPQGAAQKVWLKSRTRGTISIAGMPGGILEPQTPFGEIKIDNNQVHVGGVLDVFLRAGFPQQRSVSLVGVNDAKPLRFGVDLESQGADDDILVALTELKTGSVATKASFLPPTDTEADLFVAIDETAVGGVTTQSWFPTKEDEGRYIQLIRSGITTPSTAVEFKTATTAGTATDVIDRAAGSFLTDGYVNGMTLITKRASVTNNDRVFKVGTVTATRLTLNTVNVVTSGGSDSTAILHGLYGVFQISKVLETSFIGSTKAVHLKIKLVDEDTKNAISAVPVEDTASSFLNIGFRIFEKISRKGWVRDRDGTGLTPTFEGANFVTLGAEVGDSLIVESGNDAGIFSIRRVLSHLGTNDLLVLDRALASSLAVPGNGGARQGLRYRIADDMDVDIVDPVVMKIPLGTVFTGADLRTVAGSAVVSVVGGNTNFILAGTEVGDTLEVLAGDNKGKFIIKSFDGSAATLSATMKTSQSSVTFKLYRDLEGITRPLVRVKKVELQDAAGQPTGITVPYGAIIDARVFGGLANREAGKLVESFTGKATTATKFVDTTVNFTAKGVVKGDRLVVLEGVDIGEYTVDTISTTTNANDSLNVIAAGVTGGKSFQDTTTLNIHYTVGQPSTGKVRLYFLEPTSVELDTGITGGRLEFKGSGSDTKEFRFSEVEGSLLLPPFGSGKGNPRGARVATVESVGGGLFNSIVELTSTDHPDLYEAEVVVGDTLEVFEGVQFEDWLGKVFGSTDRKMFGTPAGLRSTLGSNLVTLPANSLIDFMEMGDLKGQQLIINSGPDAGNFVIEEVVGSRSLRLSKVLTTTTAPIQGADTPSPATGAGANANFRDGQLLLGTGGEVGNWYLKDLSDSGNYGQVGDYIKIFECNDPAFEGTFKILSLDLAGQRARLEPLVLPTASLTAADSFSWVSIKAVDIAKTIEHPFAIYKVTPTETAALEVAPKRTSGPVGILVGNISVGSGPAGNTRSSAKIKLTVTTGSLTGVARGDRLEVLKGVNRGMYPIDIVDTGSSFVEIFVNPTKEFSVIETGVVFRIWAGAHGGRRLVKVGTFKGSSGKVSKGALLPYRVRRPKVHRVSSTEMVKNKDGTLFFVDLTCESQGAGNDRNLAKSSRLTVTKGARVDGYTYAVGDSTLSFSPKELVNLIFSRRFLPVGSSDAPENTTELTGRNLGVTYEVSTVTRLVDDLLRSDNERPNNANPLARHFLPSYVQAVISYKGGSSATLVGTDVEEFINALAATQELEVSDVEALVTRRGATFVEHPLELVSITHDIERKLVVERSDNKLGSTTVPFNGTARISAFFAKVGDGLSITRTP